MNIPLKPPLLDQLWIVKYNVTTISNAQNMIPRMFVDFLSSIYFARRKRKQRIGTLKIAELGIEPRTYWL